MIFVDTNILSETVKLQPDPKVAAWIRTNDRVLVLSTIALAEISYGIERTREAARAKRLHGFLVAIQKHFSGRIYAFDERSALIYGKIMGEASRAGYTTPIPDVMIAAIALRRKATQASRNTADFEFLKVKLINPWET